MAWLKLAFWLIFPVRIPCFLYPVHRSYLATTNAQPDKLGIPLTAGTNTVVLGQKGSGSKVKKCAWFCSSEGQTCEEKCWAAEDAQSAAVTDGGELADKNVVERPAECQFVAKGNLGPLIICAVPAVDGGKSIGAGNNNFNDVGRVLFWRDTKPQLVC